MVAVVTVEMCLQGILGAHCLRSKLSQDIHRSVANSFVIITTTLDRNIGSLLCRRPDMPESKEEFPADIRPLFIPVRLDQCGNRRCCFGPKLLEQVGRLHTNSIVLKCMDEHWQGILAQSGNCRECVFDNRKVRVL